MSKENLNAPQPTPQVLCAAMQYLHAAVQMSNFRTLRSDVLSIVEVLLLTEFLEEKELREKVSLLLMQVTLLTQAFENISDQEILNLNTEEDDSRS